MIYCCLFVKVDILRIHFFVDFSQNLYVPTNLFIIMVVKVDKSED